MMITAIAIDDEPPALRVVENFCSKVDFIDLKKSFYKPNEALEYLGNYPVDLLFLDIRMPSMTGLQLYRHLPYDAMVIFTTAYSEYAVEGFNLSAIDYLLKPFSYERFMQAVNKASEYYQFLHHAGAVSQPYFFVRADYSLVRINYSEILYVEGLDDYVKIHLEERKTVVARSTMKSIMEKLPAADFVRVHRSYIVPLVRIERVRNKSILLKDKEEEVPIGRSYEKEFFEVYTGN